MKNKLNLKKNYFQSAKIAVKRGNLYSIEILDNLKNLEFEEILKFMEENGFKDPIDTSYLSYEGFYLIEVILNKYLSEIYGDVLASSAKENKTFLETYYLKYQIHNLMATIRCKISNEKEIEPYLIGDNRRIEKYKKAFDMPIEDSLVYMSKKLGFDENLVLENYNLGLFELENHLYSKYYSKLFSIKLSYNSRDEVIFTKFIRKYVDILNARGFLKLKVETIESLKFEEIFVNGGNISIDIYTNLRNSSENDILKELSKLFDKEINSISSLDKYFNEHKLEGTSLFKKIRFGSPFYSLKFFFELEKQVNYLRSLLKAKYMKLSKDEINSLMEVQN